MNYIIAKCLAVPRIVGGGWGGGIINVKYPFLFYHLGGCLSHKSVCGMNGGQHARAFTTAEKNFRPYNLLVIWVLSWAAPWCEGDINGRSYPMQALSQAYC